MRLNPLRNDSAHPPDGAFGVVCWPVSEIKSLSIVGRVSQRRMGEAHRKSLMGCTHPTRLLRGSPRKDHPCRRRPRPFTPPAASMPLAPLRADSIRPPERGVRRRLMVRLSVKKQSVVLWLFTNFRTSRIRFPFRRPSVGAAQGDARHGCRARRDGTWMSLRAGPRSSAGGREVLRSKTRMQGWPSFWLLFLGHTRKSDSPSRAKPASRTTRQRAAARTATPHMPRPAAHQSRSNQLNSHPKPPQ